VRTAVLVGGTGFLGSHLAERLASSGTRTLVLSRSGRWPWGAAPGGVSCSPFDLETEASIPALDDAIGGTDVVVHLAGALFRPSTAAARYRALHVEGARRVVDACRRAVSRDGRTRRLVHVSTTGVLGPTGPVPLPESAPARPGTMYETTKHEGEVAALAARGNGFEVVVARPGLVYGPRDLHLVALWRAISRGRFRLLAGGRALWQPVHVTDVARGLAALAEFPGIDGEVFHLAGPERRTVREIAETIASSLGVSVPGPGIPFAAAYLAGALVEALFAPFGGDPPLSRSRVRTLTEDRVYDISHARDRIGWEPIVGVERGIGETTAWYRSEGLL
jgi:nucleoside-diphosphate-sugar epimerase